MIRSLLSSSRKVAKTLNRARRSRRGELAVGVLLGIFISIASSGCGGGSSAPPLNPTPSIAALSPNGAAAKAVALTLNVHGSNFVQTSVVQWDGSSRPTTFVSSSQLQAHVMAADLANPGKAMVTVVNPAPGGGSSNAATFTIAADTVAFQSSRALNGADAVNTNSTSNIWAMNPDGSSQAALTKLTAFGADSFRPVWSPDGSKIASRSQRALDGSNAANPNVTSNIWVMNADGSGATPLTKLTATNAGSRTPVWAPDSSKLAFASARALDGSNAVNTNGSDNIWVMNADGSGATPLTKLTATNADSFRPVWAPDGSKIAFSSSGALDGSNNVNTNGTVNIWVMNADGSGATPVTKLTASSFSADPVWSPDGSKIAFESNRALDGSNAVNTIGTGNIWLMNADGSGATPLTKHTAGGAVSLDYRWSPDGSKLAFASEYALDGSNNLNTNGIFNIWVMNADGSGTTPLTKLTAVNANSFDPAWSPDGSKLFFDSARALGGSNAVNTNGTFNIWVMTADGSGATPLTQLTAAGADSTSPSQP